MLAARGAIVVVVLLGPTALAFFSGGYFDRPRLVAGIVAWAAVAGSAVVFARIWPRTRAAWLALGGVTALTVWTIVSIAWSPLGDEAQADSQRVVLYLGAVLAATAALRARGAARAVEPAIAFGALLVVCEGLSERLFPGLFRLTRDPFAGGRLSQPLTYWNAMGIASAMGFVLFVRMGGDTSRRSQLRLAASAAAPIVALGLYLTLSRGAILAAGVGLAVLLRLAPSREQAISMLATVAGAVPGIVAAAAFSDVRTFHGSVGSRETQGLAVLAALALGMLVSAGVVAWRMKRQAAADATDEPDPVVRAISLAGMGAAAVAVLVAIVLTATSKVSINVQPTAASARLATSETIRGDFWRSAVTGFLAHPVKGVGTGGFETEFRLHRTILYSVRDVHSLYLETLCELGIVGGLALLVLMVGVGACARRAYRLDPGADRRLDRSRSDVGGPCRVRLGLGDAGRHAAGACCWLGPSSPVAMLGPRSSSWLRPRARPSSHPSRSVRFDGRTRHRPDRACRTRGRRRSRGWLTTIGRWSLTPRAGRLRPRRQASGAGAARHLAVRSSRAPQRRSDASHRRSEVPAVDRA